MNLKKKITFAIHDISNQITIGLLNKKMKNGKNINLRSKGVFGFVNNGNYYRKGGLYSSSPSFKFNNGSVV